ncbi:MAG: S8 family serine peptidase [Rhodospirillaceae bacterium]|nr:S8 family serine peptidase [Rhodospirillaceae bacterium]
MIAVFVALMAMFFGVITGSPTQAASVVKIGIVDLGIERADYADLENVTVRTMAFWTSGTAEARKQDKSHRNNHGEEMVRTAVRNFRAIDKTTPIIVYVATPFRADPVTGALQLNLDDLQFAYEWFAHEDVKLVGQMFVGRDTEDQRAALAKATERGLVVMASAGNGPRSNAVPPYPAAYDDAISISTTALTEELSREKNRNSYVDFSVAPKAMSAIMYRADPEAQSLQGSSAATAAALGMLAALHAKAPVRDRADAMAMLSCVARPTDSVASGKAWGNGVLVASEIAAKMANNNNPCARTA